MSTAQFALLLGAETVLLGFATSVIVLGFLRFCEWWANR